MIVNDGCITTGSIQRNLETGSNESSIRHEWELGMQQRPGEFSTAVCEFHFDVSMCINVTSQIEQQAYGRLMRHCFVY